VKETILRLSSPLGESIDLIKLSWRGKKNGESLSLVSGIHGDQLNGLIVSQRLAQFLDRITREENKEYELRGTVQIFPVVNIHALQTGNRVWGYDNLDMDLSFPGSSSGEDSEQISRAILQHTAESTYGMIIKSPSALYEDAPHIQCHQPERWGKKLAGALNINIVREMGDSPTFQLELYYQWVQEEISAFIICGGKPQTISPALCDLLFDGIVNFMIHAGLLRSTTHALKIEKPRYFKNRAEKIISSSAAGIFIPDIQVGCEVKQGQKLGAVKEVYSGETLEEILAPEDGVVLTLRCHPVIYEKEPLVVLLTGRKAFLWPF
jgi:predicted deacylase